jgi:hypothetical protein
MSVVAAAPDQSYSNAVQAISAFAGTEAGESLPPLPKYQQADDAVAALLAAKGVAATWFNQVYPQMIAVPAGMAAAGDAIERGLETLARVGQKLEADPDDRQVAKAFAAAGEQERRVVAPLAAQAHALAQAVDGFYTSLVDATAELRRATTELLQLSDLLAARVSEDQARFDAARHATCPRQADIDAAFQALRDDTIAANELPLFTNQLDDDALSAHLAVNALAYARGTWQSIDAQAAAMLASLTHIQNDPVAALAVDIAAARANLSTFLGHIHSIATRAAKTVAARSAV